jgi:hypothetical protein
VTVRLRAIERGWTGFNSRGPHILTGVCVGGLEVVKGATSHEGGRVGRRVSIRGAQLAAKTLLVTGIQWVGTAFDWQSNVTVGQWALLLSCSQQG